MKLQTWQVYSKLLRKIPQMSRNTWLANQVAHPSWIPVIDSGCMWKGMIVTHLNVWVFFKVSSFLQHQWRPRANNPDWLFIHLKWLQYILCFVICFQCREWNRIFVLKYYGSSLINSIEILPFLFFVRLGANWLNFFYHILFKVLFT